MKLFNANLKTVVLRFYLMMGVIILAGFTGLWWLGLVGFFLFISGLLGLEFKANQRTRTSLKGTLGNRTKQAA